ncbi:MAG: hypothetical protein KF891_04310 [Rhizobacter sp.]|nr:hypothetical protein [Rhizobacter sp.]
MNLFEPLQPSGPRPASPGQTLQPGDRLEDFEITEVLGLTSFGVLYVARNARDGSTHAIKEYMPASIAVRDTDGQIALTDPLHAEAYQRGLQSFVNEALTLSQFDHPNLLRVTCIWEANGTAYRAMPCLSGTTLLAQRASSPAPATQAQLQRLRDALLDALLALSQAGLAHGQIEPLNIYLLDDGLPVLMDFDAVHQAMLSDLRKPHVDAYADPVGVQDLLSLDLRAVAAVLHFAVSNEWIPAQGSPSKKHQVLGDVLLRFKDHASILDYRPEFLAAIDTALSLPPADRPATITEFRALFEPKTGGDGPGTAPSASSDAAAPSEAGPEAEAEAVSKPARASKRPPAPAAPPPFPLNSSESVLALLANFGRGPTPAAEDVEPFENPVVPTLTEEAEPTLPPLRASLFDAIDAGEYVPQDGVGYAPVGYKPMPRVPRNPWQRRLAIAGIAATVIGCVVALGWQLFS